MFTAYIYSCEIQQNWIFYFMIFFVIYYDFSKIQLKFFKKSKRQNYGYCSKQSSKPLEGGKMHGLKS